MNKLSGNAIDILTDTVSGFHQYTLQPQPHLSYVSQSFCDMVGYTPKELLSDNADLYAPLVHPADYEIYAEFLRNLIHGKQQATAQYRIIRKDGSVKWFTDTATIKLLPRGQKIICSTLTDITSVKQENEELHFLNETIPCGFIRYTCEKTPRITYINDRMLKLLRIPEPAPGDAPMLDIYSESIYLWIPIEERQRFAQFLERVNESDAPVAGEMSVLRCDGTKARLYGWITKSSGRDGQPEFQSVCMDVTQRYEQKKATETNQYLNAISELYDKIFEYDFSARTVKCLRGQNSDMFKWLENVPMPMEDATEKWVLSGVQDDQKQSVLEYFRNYFRPEIRCSDARPPQIQYIARSSDGTMRRYTGIFLKVDSNVSLYCCRRASDDPESTSLRDENASLRNMNENMQELVLRLTDGIVAFEIEDGLVKPLHVSDNISKFFGYTTDEWVALAQSRHTIRDFVSKCSVGYEEFMVLLETGEAEFEYTDIRTKRPRRIKAVCSNQFGCNDARQHVMLYDITDTVQKPAQTEPPRIFIRTFGYFDVFVGDKPIAFRNEKSKELFALLVDRRGGYVSSEEAIGFLWEDEAVTPLTLARYRKVALRLKNTLEEYGVADVVESVNGRRRIVTEKVRCDLYEYLTGKEEFAQLFKGSYLTNYSWGETTLGELQGKLLL